VKALLVSPELELTYWNGTYALHFANKRCLFPPLGLATVAALLPRDWECRLVDVNVEELTDADLRWADVVLVGGLLVQRRSQRAILERSRRLGVRTVAGGPYVTSLEGAIEFADHAVVGEAEAVVPELAADLEAGVAKPVYRAPGFADISTSPIPRFDLLRVDRYLQMAVQYSRGCPYTCEFCDIPVLYGRKIRAKPAARVIAELEAVLATGFTGDMMLVVDNFLGTREARETLEAMAAWRERRRPRLEFYTEASLNVLDDASLLDLMLRAGFTKVFIGIETPSEESLREARKYQNFKIKRGLVQQIHWILRQGMDVGAGMIVGFDNDGPEIFDRVIEFLQRAAIPYVQIGMLVALPGTPLWKRLEPEGRLLPDLCGDQFGRTNVVPRMPSADLVRGYRRVLETLYDPRTYFERCLTHLSLWTPRADAPSFFAARDLVAGAKAVWHQGVLAPYRREYWRFLGTVAQRAPRKLVQALHMAAAGHHFISYTREHAVPTLCEVERAVADASPTSDVTLPTQAVRH
jgi:radical SAM superfamily enzyme YgiQ (UPF0313 family)